VSSVFRQNHNRCSRYSTPETGIKAWLLEHYRENQESAVAVVVAVAAYTAKHSLVKTPEQLVTKQFLDQGFFL
jgi:hypothetical protein